MYRYKISEIKLDIFEDLNQIPDQIRKKIKKPGTDIIDVEILRESVDARNKNDIFKVYTVAFQTNEKLNLEETVDEQTISLFQKKAKRPMNPPIIVGFGPSGIFAAWALIQLGIHPIVLERGKPMEERDVDVDNFWNHGLLNPDSNVQFGEGGAGAYSDGKLNTGTRDARNRLVLRTLVAAGADPEILYKKRPHIGTDVLKSIVTQLRKEILMKGGDIRFSSKVTNLIVENGQVKGVEVNNDQVIDGNHVVLAIGHSARDTFQMIFDMGLSMEPKPFSVGIRIQHPQELINYAQYGKHQLAELLGPAEYKLVHHCENGRGIYSFCMCPGGRVITASSEPESVVVNGMSYHARDGYFANSGILTDVRVDDFFKRSPLDGIDFQRSIERRAYQETGAENKAPQTVWEAFSTDKNNILRRCLPEFAVDSLLEGIPAFARKLKGFDRPETIMTGVETRSSSPIRIIRNATQMSNIKGIYPCGEGAGYAGGIVSAAVDGIKAIEAMVELFQ